MYTIIPENKNPVLRQIAKIVPVSEIKSARIRDLVADMKKLLSKEEFGVALAAPQVGEPLRLFIVSGRALARGKRNAPDSAKASSGKPDQPTPVAEAEGESVPDQVYINPELLKMSRGKSEKHEGCLSIRRQWGKVPRAEKVTVRAHDENGVRFTRGASGFLAHIFQHELDHLEGILYTDKATEMYDDPEVQQS
ncbi:MAG: peptide deformylase [bacterium]|nr:peptide deformylase [bacterium]